MRQPSITMSRLRGLLRRDNRLSIAMLSQVSGVAVSNLSAALRDPNVVYLGAQRESELWELAQRCIAVIDSILPLTLARGDGGTLRLLVRSNRSEDEIRTMVLSLLEPLNQN